MKKKFQKLWDNIKRPILRFTRLEEGEDLQTKGMHKVFNDIISENFPHRKNEMENQI